MSSPFSELWGRSGAPTGANQRTKAGSDDPLLTQTKGPRRPEELDELWTQTRLPKKYRASISDQELDAMASQAEQQNRPLREVLTDKVRAAKEQQDAKEFEEMPEHRHTFFTATHREGFKFSPWKHLAGVLFMAFAPWLLFLGIGVLFIYIYYSLPWITLFIVLIIGALSCLLLLSGAMSQDIGRTFLGVLFLIATITGGLAGMANYNERVFHYWSATEGRQYTNVRSDSLAAAHADAGVLVFTDEAVVDTTKTIGYKSGNVYCVAPISRRDQTHASTIQYWAAGVDCCNGRGFFSCDDTADKAAKSGLVIREIPANMLTKSESDYYMHAVEMSTEIYGLTSSKEPFFVRWTKDVATKAESYLINGWVHWAYYGLAFLVINFVLAVLFQGVIFQQKNKAEEKKDNSATGTGEKEALIVTKGPGAHRQDQNRWQSLDNPDYESKPQVDPMEHFENDMRGIDTTSMPVQQRPTPTFSGGLENSNNSIATRYDDNIADQRYGQGNRYGNQGVDQRYR